MEDTNHLTDPLTARLREKGRLVADGGMGTSLFNLGLRPGGTPESWNIDRPQQVASVHRGFVDAGADIILTNTFGGTRTRLDLDGLGNQVEELNSAGVAIAREVAQRADRPVLVAGSIGPTGALFEPLGLMSHDEAVEVFTEQVKALAGAGCDVIWIETLSSIEELAAAQSAAAGAGLPIVTTMSFDTNGHTMMGIAPAQLTEWWRQPEGSPAAIGANCGIGPADVVMAVAEMHAAAPQAAIIAKANCGIPEVIDGTLWYPTSSDDMSDYAALALDAGARIVGACCGSVPAHIAQIRRVVDSYEPGDGVELAEVERRLGKVTRPQQQPSRRTRRRD